MFARPMILFPIETSTELLGVGLLGMNFPSQHSSLRIRPRWLGYIQHCLGSAGSNNDLGTAWVYYAQMVEYLHYIFDESEGQLYFFPCTC